MRPIILTAVLLGLAIGLIVSGCGKAKVARVAEVSEITEQIGQLQVALDRVEVAHSWVSGVEGQKPEFYVDAKEKRGSPLDLAFIFSLSNPSDERIMLDELRFTMAFEGFELIEPSVYEDQWIPSGATNQVRVHATIDAYTSLLAMLVPAGNVERWKAMDVKPASLIKKWWETVGDFAFPIEVRNGVATFVRPNGEAVIASFQATFPEQI